MHFDYEIRYKKGVDNSVADALSRVPEPMVHALSSFVIPLELITKIKASWDFDPFIQKLLTEKQQDPNSHPKFSWLNGELRRNERLVVGNDLHLKTQLLSIFHNSALAGHSGSLATYKMLYAIVYWPKLRKEVREFVRVCVTCQRYKPENTSPAGLLQPLPPPAGIFTDLTMDFIEALPSSQGKNTILVVVDRLSKYAHFMALAHPFSAKDVVVVFMNYVFKLHGMPEKVVSERGAISFGALWKDFMSLLGVDLLYSIAYHPETDGQSEVVNRCLQCYLRCSMGEKPHSWLQWLGLAKFWYNTSYHSSIKMTPFEALYGFPPPLHVPYLPGDSKVEAVDISLRDREAIIEVLKFNLQRAADRMKKQADQGRRDKQYAIGDWVWLKLQAYR